MNILDIAQNHITSKEEGKITYDFNLTVFTQDGEVKFSVGKISTSWMSTADNFINRIRFENLNPCFLNKHIAKEIEIKNLLDAAVDFLNEEKYAQAISLLSDVLYYDPEYGEALFFKSKAFFNQGHFVKALRHYKKAVKADETLRDVDYHRRLLKKSSKERDSFPKIKTNIYAGDEYFAKGEFKKAVACYDRALSNPTSFKTKILSKLLNKKATALLKLNETSHAIDVFKKSVSVKPNDYAYFYLGLYYDIGCMKRALKISKKQLLEKAFKLDESGQYDLALECLDDFFKNHYNVDDDYKMALNLKLAILEKLNEDTCEIESIINSCYF